MQILKVLLAGNGHRELRFENHILIDPPESLTYFNIPLVVANTADIALWVLGLALSASVTLAIKHR